MIWFAIASTVALMSIAFCMLAMLGFLTQAVTALNRINDHLLTLSVVNGSVAVETRALAVAAHKINDRLAKPLNLIAVNTSASDTKH